MNSSRSKLAHIHICSYICRHICTHTYIDPLMQICAPRPTTWEPPLSLVHTSYRQLRVLHRLSDSKQTLATLTCVDSGWLTAPPTLNTSANAFCIHTAYMYTVQHATIQQQNPISILLGARTITDCHASSFGKHLAARHLSRRRNPKSSKNIYRYNKIFPPLSSDKYFWTF